jgi:ABC-type Fe3+ transport system permease subunit
MPTLKTLKANKKQEASIRQKEKLYERRENKDYWARLFILINFLAWGVLFVLVLVFHKAQPEFETVFDRFYQLDLRTNWDMQFLQYLVYTILLGLILSIAGLGLSLFRARRKTDHKKPLILLVFLYLILFILSWFIL